VSEKTGSESWITFAAIVAGVAGALNVMFGLAATYGFGPFAAIEVLYASAYALGLLLLFVGGAQAVTAFLLTRRIAFGRVAAIALAASSILLWTLWLGAYQTAAIVAIALDILVIYGMSVTGEHFKQG
jgi:hypothetical protein